MDISGTWTGSIASANMPTRSITMTVVQGGSCVDGVWKDSVGGWSGAISGFATSDGYDGQISLERTADSGGKCMALATIAGPVANGTLTWKAADFTPTAECSGDLPRAVVLSAKRQP